MLKDKILEYLDEHGLYDLPEEIAQDIADIAREYHLVYMEELLKENIELKQVIAHSDGVQLQNEDLIRDNDRLKKQLENISKDRIIKVLKKYMSEISGDVNCAYFNKIANEIMEGK